MATAFLGYLISLKWCEISLHTHENLTYLNYLSLPTAMSVRLSDILKKQNIKPVAVFEKLHTTKTRNKAKESLQDLAGIYMILNLVDGNSFYVGSATSNRLYTRLMKHLYYKKGNVLIAASVKSLGLKNFAFIVLDIFPFKIKDKTNLTLLSLEQYYIDLIKPNYNILPLAGNSFGFKHNLETLQHMRDNYSEIRREKIGTLNRGKSLSIKTSELLRKAALTRLPMSLETREKCKTRGIAVTVSLLRDNTIVGHFEDIVSAAKYIKCGEKTIRRALKVKGIVKSTYKVTKEKNF
jgi:group I intron endonuclease